MSNRPLRSANPGMVKVSIWLEDVDGEDWVLSDEDDDFIFIHAKRDAFQGRVEEFGGNYITLIYDSPEEAYHWAYDDARVLHTLLEQNNEA